MVRGTPQGLFVGGRYGMMRVEGDRVQVAEAPVRPKVEGPPCEGQLRVHGALRACWRPGRDVYITAGDARSKWIPFDKVLDLRFTAEGVPVVAWRDRLDARVAFFTDPAGKVESKHAFPAQEGGVLSHDGLRAAFVGYPRGSETRQLTVVDVASGRVTLRRDLALGPAAPTPGFSHDGRAVYVGYLDGSLYRFALPEASRTRVTDAKWRAWVAGGR